MRRRRLRVLVLVHEELVPPKDVRGIDVTQAEWKMEFDVIETLGLMGHEVEVVGLRSDLTVLDRALKRFHPDVLFNLLEDFHDLAVNDQNWVSYLELLLIPYTGCNPRGMLLARDKALSKKVLAYHGVPLPGFAVFGRDDPIEVPPGLSYPLIVKSLIFDGSVGISQASVVSTAQRLTDRVRFVHESIGSDAICEEFIEGRELYVGVMGNEKLQTFPVWELHFGKRPKTTRLIATDRVKWSDQYKTQVGVRTEQASLTETQARSVRRLARKVYRLLNLSGYARIDFRMGADGEAYFLEANPNPQLAYGEDFAESAEKAGIGYESLLERLLNLAMTRRWE
ncbi:MAG: D-alanine--D-alanine ligase family protein [Vicinamibacteria bacterium]